ncbi:MAG: ABC transporter substrate-binding protein [Candidatus Tectomicrobia bacterium]|nr:ABC transporter substrate-binding protein [Candidatus Tectomicrobia bacterium]
MIRFRLPLLYGFIICLLAWWRIDNFRGEAQPERPTEVVNRLIGVIRGIPLIEPQEQADAQQGQEVGQTGMQPRQRGQADALEMVDLAGVSRRTLGKHWAERSLDEQSEFITLFSQLLLHVAFPQSAGFFHDLDMPVIDEHINGQQASVTTLIQHPEEGDITIGYLLVELDGNWRIQDIEMEGVSLVRNLRTQFNKIITHFSYSELLRRMNEKLTSAMVQTPP